MCNEILIKFRGFKEADKDGHGQSFHCSQERLSVLLCAHPNVKRIKLYSKISWNS